MYPPESKAPLVYIKTRACAYPPEIGKSISGRFFVSGSAVVWGGSKRGGLRGAGLDLLERA